MNIRCVYIIQCCIKLFSIFLPTDPKKFLKVTGNDNIFLLGLMEDPGQIQNVQILNLTSAFRGHWYHVNTLLSSFHRHLVQKCPLDF